MSPANPPPPDEDDDDDDEPRERSTFGKILHGCLIVIVTIIVAAFLVFGACVIMISS